MPTHFYFLVLNPSPLSPTSDYLTVPARVSSHFAGRKYFYAGKIPLRACLILYIATSSSGGWGSLIPRHPAPPQKNKSRVKPLMFQWLLSCMLWSIPVLFFRVAGETG